MLKAIRENAQGLVVWIIGIIIVIPFALWGIQDYLGGGGAIEAPASIDGQDIEKDDFDKYYRVYRQTELRKIEKLAASLPLSVKNQLLDEKVMRKAALDSMIRSRLLLKTALTSGFDIGDRQLSGIIEVMPVFQKDGVFDKELYNIAVRNQGLTPVDFENSLRNDWITQQVMSGILFSEFATKFDLQETARLIKQQRKAGYMIIPASRYEKEVSPTEEQLKEYFDAHDSEYVAEEQVKIKYIELSHQDIAPGVDAGDEALQAYYDEHANDYATPDTSEADAKISEIQKSIKQGTSFSELAKKHSEDEGSRDNGGDLGYFGKGVMEKAFEDKVFSMKKGAVSGPVVTAFGVHIIKLTGIKDEERQASHILVRIDRNKTRIKSFDEVKDEVRQEVINQLVEDRFIEQSETLTNLTYEVPNTLEDAANALELKIHGSEYFSRAGGKGLTKHNKVVTAAFSEDVLAGNNSEPIEVDRNHYIVLRIDKHNPARRKTLEEVRDVIHQKVVNKQSSEKAANTGGIIVKRLEKGDAAAGISQEHNLKWHEPAMLKRASASIDSGVLRTVFSTPRTTGETPTYTGVMLGNGDYAVVGLYAVEDGDLEKIGDKEKRALHNKLVRARGEGTAQQFLARSREIAHVTIYEQPLQ